MKASTVSNDRRRPLQSRNTQWASLCVRLLARTGITPNQVSVLSVVFSFLSGLCLLLTTRGLGLGVRAGCFVLAAVFIQLRLLCNLFDGMLAIEYGMKSKTGEIYNELPDRFADLLIIVSAGYAAGDWSWAIQLGWFAGALAVLTAYVRALGVISGAGCYFSGPMAKPHRMALMTFACLCAALEAGLGYSPRVLYSGLILIVVGCVVTLIRRLRLIVRALEAR